MPTRKLALKGAGLKVDINAKPPEPIDVVPPGVGDKTELVMGAEKFECLASDLEELRELGRGTYGVVVEMRHRHNGTIMAVKKIRATVDSEERKRMLMDLNVSIMAVSCPYTVTFYGSLFREGDVWICMEIMDKSLHQLYKLVYETLNKTIPEPVLEKIAYSVITALKFLKEKLNVLHRDVKPSNILINSAGEIKLCDFGIAGELVNSFCITDIGCKPYLAPERINPQNTGSKYDDRSDVWSFGITIYELALGQFPYPSWKNVFDRLKYVVYGDPPEVAADAPFSPEFKDFVKQCLTKDSNERPKYKDLIYHPFIVRGQESNFNVGEWYRDIVEQDPSAPSVSS